MAKLKTALIASAISATVLISLFLAIETLPAEKQTSEPPFFVGVEIGWLANVDQSKAIIDKVKDYTNLIIIASPSITAQESTLNETCDYAYNAGMYLMVYFSMQIFPDNYTLTNTTQMSISTLRPFMWEMGAKQKYGERFLGVYFNDEPGGQVLDSNSTQNLNPNYSEIARIFIQNNTDKMNIYAYLRDRGLGAPIFTSDYGLYWYDYESGFDVVLAQLGWNNSRLVQVALTRGAAAVHNKNWGVMVTWTYTETPYLESGSALYEDLVLAFDSGAKYMAVYDSSAKYQNTTLTEDHFNALKNFWNYTQENPNKHGNLKADTALILPKDYGFGFRSTIDSVWGIKPDENTQKMYTDVQKLLNNYGSTLDIVYNEPIYIDKIAKDYNELITWTNP